MLIIIFRYPERLLTNSIAEENAIIKEITIIKLGNNRFFTDRIESNIKNMTTSYVLKCFPGYIFIMCLIGITVTKIVRKIIKITLHINTYSVNGFTKYV